MKKMLSIAVLAIVLLVAMATCVNAATKASALDQIYEIGVKYGMTSADKVRLERYLNNNDVTEEEATLLVEKAKEVAKVYDRTGATKFADLSDSQKDEVKAIATEAAKLLDVSIVFKTKSAEIYKGDKMVEVILETGGKLSYTGNEVNVAVIAGSIAVIALAAVVLVKKVTK